MEQLVELLNDRNRKVREAAFRVLRTGGAPPTPNTIKRAQQYVKDPQTRAHTRELAERVLSEWEPPSDDEKPVSDDEKPVSDDKKNNPKPAEPPSASDSSDLFSCPSPFGS